MPLLHWLTRNEDLRAADRMPYRLLDTVPDLSHGGGDDGLLVQGDNLEALKALLPFNAGRVKCIYFDPRWAPDSLIFKAGRGRLRRARRLRETPLGIGHSV